MWWGGVECYLREIKQGPARRFVLWALKAFGGLPHSASTEHIGGVKKMAWDDIREPPLHCVRCGGQHRLTDWWVCISKWLHLYVPSSTWENAFYFEPGLLWVSSYDLSDNKAGRPRMVLGFCFAGILVSFHLLSLWKPQISSSVEHRERYPYFEIMNVAQTREHKATFKKIL